MTKIFPLFFFILSLASISLDVPPGASCKVIAVADGDTFTVLQGTTQIKIRVDAIDAPEKGMPYSKASKKYLSTLCFGKFVTIKALKTDRYGRTVARAILPDGRDVSTEMIKAGYAWHYKKYSSDTKLAQLELAAKAKKMGLWADKKPIAPWEVRQMHRSGISTKKLFESAPEK